ncbi:unnamed protein product, partial [Larinioides sclopetarius]
RLPPENPNRLRITGPYQHRKNRRANVPRPVDDYDIEIINFIVNDLNTLYAEIINRRPNGPRISKAI